MRRIMATDMTKHTKCLNGMSSLCSQLQSMVEALNTDLKQPLTASEQSAQRWDCMKVCGVVALFYL